MCACVCEAGCAGGAGVPSVPTLADLGLRLARWLSFGPNHCCSSDVHRTLLRSGSCGRRWEGADTWQWAYTSPPRSCPSINAWQQRQRKATTAKHRVRGWAREGPAGFTQGLAPAAWSLFGSGVEWKPHVGPPRGPECWGRHRPGKWSDLRPREVERRGEMLELGVRRPFLPRPAIHRPRGRSSGF